LATRKNPFPFHPTAHRRCYRLTDRRPMVRMVRSFMHKHPRRDRGLTNVMAILAPIALLLMVAIVPVHVGSRASVAAPSGPLIIDGTVNSSAGSPVVGADVVVTILDGATVKATQSFTSVVYGFYTVTFAYGDWDYGNTILVVATYGSDVGQNSTIASFDFQTIDVKLGTVIGIPELGGPAMTALTVSAIGMMVVFYARRRRSESP